MIAGILELVQASMLMQLRRNGKPITECIPMSQRRLFDHFVMEFLLYALNLSLIHFERQTLEEHHCAGK